MAWLTAGTAQNPFPRDASLWLKAFSFSQHEIPGGKSVLEVCGFNWLIRSLRDTSVSLEYLRFCQTCLKALGRFVGHADSWLGSGSLVISIFVAAGPCATGHVAALMTIIKRLFLSPGGHSPCQLLSPTHVWRERAESAQGTLDWGGDPCTPGALWLLVCPLPSVTHNHPPPPTLASHVLTTRLCEKSCGSRRSLQFLVYRDNPAQSSALQSTALNAQRDRVIKLRKKNEEKMEMRRLKRESVGQALKSKWTTLPSEVSL